MCVIIILIELHLAILVLIPLACFQGQQHQKSQNVGCIFQSVFIQLSDFVWWLCMSLGQGHAQNAFVMTGLYFKEDNLHDFIFSKVSLGIFQETWRLGM